jgi:hypothetical protein
VHFVEKDYTKLELCFWSMTRCELTLEPHPRVAATVYHNTNNTQTDMYPQSIQDMVDHVTGEGTLQAVFEIC